jgi:hypothetical protein
MHDDSARYGTSGNIHSFRMQLHAAILNPSGQID